MEELKQIFGERVSFDRSELGLYTSDVGDLPDVMNIGTIDLLINRKPTAVVQPINKDEVVSLVKHAALEKIPLTPRGAATSGIGGAIPTKGGIVVDFIRMNKILHIDKEKKTVTVESGVVWKQLENTLNKQGMALRIYPTSAPSSTVAGWIASGGIGIGSFEFGSIKENVVSVELVLPNGGIKEASGDELEMVNECLGTTGFITKATIKVKKHEKVVPVAISFEKLKNMHNALLETIKNIPIWSCSFETKEYVKLKHDAKGSHSEATHTLMIAIPKSRYKKRDFEKIAARYKGKINGEAAEEWEDRFCPLRIKKLGPSVIPGEVYLPIEKLKDFITAIDEMLRGRIYGIEGTLANRRETSVRLWILSDERKNFGLSYTMEWGLPLLFLNTAKKFGGRTYQVGIWLAKEAKNYFGTDRLKRIRKYKKSVDPSGIMNPGKIIAPLRFSAAFGILPSLSGVSGKIKIGAYEPKPPAVNESWLLDHGDHVFSCAICSYCRDTCPVYKEIGWESASPKGKMIFVKNYLKGTPFFPMIPNPYIDPHILQRIFQCTSCRYCEEVCQTMIPVYEVWEDLRAKAIELGYSPMKDHLRIKNNVEKYHNPYGEEHLKRDAWIPPGISFKNGAEMAYFAGCTASYRIKSHGVNAVRILQRAGVNFTYLGPDEYCCGSPFLRTGQLETAKEVIEHNIKEFIDRGIKTLVFTCPGCNMTFAHNYPAWAKKLGYEWDIKTLNILQLIFQLIKRGKITPKKSIKASATYHDPCHVGRHLKIYDEPRSVLHSIGVKLIEMENVRERSNCCGAGGGVRAAFPELANSIARKRLEEAKRTGADMLVSACPFCELSFKLVQKEDGNTLGIRNITDLVLEAMG